MEYSKWSHRQLADKIILMSKNFPEDFVTNHEEYQRILEEVFEANRDPKDISFCGALAVLNCNLEAFLYLIGEKKRFSKSFCFSLVRDYYRAGGLEEIEQHLVYVDRAFPDEYQKLCDYAKEERQNQVVQTIVNPKTSILPIQGVFVPDFYECKNVQVEVPKEGEVSFCIRKSL